MERRADRTAHRRGTPAKARLARRPWHRGRVQHLGPRWHGCRHGRPGLARDGGTPDHGVFAPRCAGTTVARHDFGWSVRHGDRRSQFRPGRLSGRLETVRPRPELRMGDSLPLPGSLPAPSEPIRRHDAFGAISIIGRRTEGPAGLGRDVPRVARRSLASGDRAPLAAGDRMVSLCLNAWATPGLQATAERRPCRRAFP